MASTRKDIVFVAGMNSSAMKPADADRLLRQYLATSARLSDQARRWIRESRPVRPKKQLAELLLAVDKRQAPSIDKDGRELREQVADIADTVAERLQALDVVASMATAQQKTAVKGSKAFDDAAQYLRFLADARAKPEAMLKQVQVPRAGGKPDVFVKQLYDATSALIAIGILLEVVAKSLKKWVD